MSKQRTIVVTTKYRGVFWGTPEPPDYSLAEHGTTVKLTGARCAIRWRTSRGFMELAEVGPNHNSKIGATADIELVDVTSVLEATEKAAEAWRSA